MPNASRKPVRKRAAKPPPKLVSVVIPAYNEEPNLRFIYTNLAAVFDVLDESFEIIFVDDGSTDDTRETLLHLHDTDPRVKAIFLSRNFGQSSALSAGIEAAKGDAVIVMDADGQDPPSVIPAMISKWKHGYEVIGGHRTRRPGQSLLKRVSAFLWYRIMRMLVGWELPLDTGEFRLIDRKVADVFRACPQRHRLVRTLTSWPGFHQTVVDYEHGIRHAGKTKYSFRSSLRLAITSITGFSLIPLRLAFLIGAIIATLAFVASLALMAPAFTDETVNLVSLSIAGLWFLGGIQCILIGIVGEYVGRTYIETQHRPLYVIRDSLGVDQ